MSVVKILDDVKAWAEEEICSKIQLKVPPEGDEPNDRDYDHTLTNPVAFAMYVPTKDKLPPKIKSVFPSVCVRFLEGADNMRDKEGGIGIQLCFSAWDPGLHGSDLLLPQADGSHRRWTGPEANDFFQRYGEGWRDVWNFVDLALRAVESATHIKGHEIDISTDVKFGPLIEQEAIADYYPFWFACVSFRLKYQLRRNIKDLKQYL